jgi:hypothetical protein
VPEKDCNTEKGGKENKERRLMNSRQDKIKKSGDRCKQLIKTGCKGEFVQQKDKRISTYFVVV